jgi:adenosylhomocysteine nucleosidase
MTPTLVLTGLELEARALARALALERLGAMSFTAFGRGDVRVGPIGVGATELVVRWDALTSDLGCPLVISAGVCGGLDPDLQPGDLVVPHHVVGPAGEILEVTSGAREALLARGAPVVRGRTMLTSACIVDSSALKARLHARSGAAAVDMESAAILTRARAAGWPVLVVRGVSDAAADEVPEVLVRLLSADARARDLARVLTSPRGLRAAMRLHGSTRRALRAVAAALATLLVGPPHPLIPGDTPLANSPAQPRAAEVPLLDPSRGRTRARHEHGEAATNPNGPERPPARS